MIEETALLEQDSTVKPLYEISPEMRRRAHAKLKKIMTGKTVNKFADKDFEPKSNQAQAEIQAEVSELFRLREEWNQENQERNFD